MKNVILKFVPAVGMHDHGSIIALFLGVVSLVFDFKMKNVVLRYIPAGGMHHHGSQSLTVGGVYTLEADPTNTYDNNAIAIFKEG
jgi:hypothetical protein